MKKAIITIGIVMLYGIIFGQDQYYNVSNKEKMKSLEWMVGEWKGEGKSMDSKTRQFNSFIQTESIEYAMDSTVLIVHGFGRANEKVVHDAYAIISVNPEGGFFMDSYLGDGSSGKYEMKKVNDTDWEWTIPTPQGEVIYHIHQENGIWTEKGEFNLNGNLFPFFEMTLQKLKR